MVITRTVEMHAQLALVTKTSCTNDKDGTSIRQRKSYNDTERYD